MEQIELKVVRSIDEIDALRQAWETWPSHRDSDIDFFLMIVDSYPEVVRPHIVALYRNQKLDAFLVGRLEEKVLDFRVGYFHVFHPTVRCLTFVYGAIHGNASDENAEILLREVMNCLRRREADVANLEFVPLHSPLYRAAFSVPGRLSRDTLPAAQAHRVMAIPQTLDEVYKRMSSSRRKTTQNRIRGLDRHPSGASKIVCYRTAEDLDRLFRDAEEIAKKTYHRGLGVGFADNALVRARLSLAARKGWLRGNVLYIGDRPIAFWIGMLYHTTFVSEYLGYDPEFRQSSPGTVLMMRAIEGFCGANHADVVTEIDFGLGDAEYKAALCEESWQEASVGLFSPTTRGLILKLVSTSTRLLDLAARKVLVSTGTLKKLKRVWRDRLAKKAVLRDSADGGSTNAVAVQTVAATEIEGIQR
jgi:hypothetical protein